MQTGQRVAVTGMLVSGALAAIKIVVGMSGHSTAVVADGFESAADVVASGFVLFGLTMAAKPADENHPYGYGRVETLTGLMIGLVLMVGGALISWNAIRRVGLPHEVLQGSIAPSQPRPRRSVVRVFVQAFAVQVPRHRKALQGPLALHIVRAQVELVGSSESRHIVPKTPPLALGQPQHQQFDDAVHQAVLNLDQVVEPGL